MTRKDELVLGVSGALAVGLFLYIRSHTSNGSATDSVSVKPQPSTSASGTSTTATSSTPGSTTATSSTPPSTGPSTTVSAGGGIVFGTGDLTQAQINVLNANTNSSGITTMSENQLVSVLPAAYVQWAQQNGVFSSQTDPAPLGAFALVFQGINYVSPAIESYQSQYGHPPSKTTVDGWLQTFYSTH